MNAVRFCAGPDNLLYWDYKMQKVQPNLALGFDLSPDAKVLTLHLRHGLRWSDGTPCTADDIVCGLRAMVVTVVSCSGLEQNPKWEGRPH